MLSVLNETESALFDTMAAGAADARLEQAQQARALLHLGKWAVTSDNGRPDYVTVVKASVCQSCLFVTT
jgi:hypothetical protein